MPHDSLLHGALNRVDPIRDCGEGREMAALVLRPKKSLKLPDISAWVNRFWIKSSSSNRMYVIAQSRRGRWWACGCSGWIRYKRCKHLKNLGLPGDHKPFEILLK